MAYTADVSAVLITGQVKYFSDKGYEVHVITNIGERTKALVEREGGVAHSIAFEREISIVKDLKSLYNTILLLHEIKPDIVNTGTPKASLLVLTASWLLRIPKRIYTCRGFRFETEKGLKRLILRKLEMLCGIFAHRIICISPSLRNLSIDMSIFSEKKSVVIGKGSSNGIDLNKFDLANLSKTKLNKVRDQFNIKNDYFIIGYAGRLHPDKGLNELLAAYDTTKATFSNTQLLLVGGIESTQIQHQLESRSNDQDLIYAGFQLEIEYFMAHFDVLVLPSYREGFGNVLIQAAALGVPVIASNVTGCKDAVKSGFNGYLFESKNYEELSSHLIKLIQSTEKREELSANGVIFSKSFDQKLIWNGIESLYQN